MVATVAEAYLQQIEDMSNTLTARMSDVRQEQLAQRPGERLNPLGFVYWHILRIWDLDVNLICRGQSEDNDAWHRAGMTEKFGYEPLGHGGRKAGNGFNYTDAEVDEVPYLHTALRAYHDVLLQETRDYVAALSDADFDAEVQFRSNPVTIGARMQHLVSHSQQHIGEIGVLRGLLGFADPTTPPRS